MEPTQNKLTMKLLKNIFLPVLPILLLGLGCIDDDQELGQLSSADQIDFEIIQDFDTDAGGNTVILKNNTPETIALWDYQQGRSTRTQDTVQYPFAGTYTISLTIMTAAGQVNLDPVTIEVTENNLDYVSDPVWTLLTGGPGNEKTWLLDANETGKSKHFSSPTYFVGEENVNSEFDGTNLVWTRACNDPEGTQSVCFIYEPNWENDTWVGTPADYGYMTFNLISGPFVQTDHNGIAGVGTESGTFYLDTDTYTLTLTDATPLSIDWVRNDAESLTSLKLLSITENTMQLAIKTSGKTEYMIENYISKAYSDALDASNGG